MQRCLYRKLVFMTCLIVSSTIFASTHPLLQWMEKTDPKIFSKYKDEFKSELQKYVDSHGRVTPTLQETLFEIERLYGPKFNSAARADYQDIVADIGGKITGMIEVPRNQTPFWFLEPGPLKDYRSTKKLPHNADYVIIGAGLTGTSAAYYLSDAAHSGKTVIVLEAGQIASQSSGRNGGNFQLLAENYLDDFLTLVEERRRIVKQRNPELSESELDKVAEFQANTLYEFNYKNFIRLKDILKRENISCDQSSAGWLKLASSREEAQILYRDFEWLQSRKKSVPMELWSADRIAQEVKISSLFSARYIPENGNYHPYKFVTQVLQKSISKGVKLYTHVTVEKVTDEGHGKVLIRTSEGSVHANKVIVATNAQTPKIFSDLSVIKTHYSQVVNMEHVTNTLKGMTLTEQRGDIYFNFPKSKTYQDGTQTRGMLHFGLDYDESTNESSESRFKKHFREMQAMIEIRFPETQGQPASRAWEGPMGFTSDRTPLIGFYHPKKLIGSRHNNIVVAAAFQGYGGSFCFQAGFVAAEMALSSQVHPDVPEEIFGPHRFAHSRSLLSTP